MSEDTGNHENQKQEPAESEVAIDSKFFAVIGYFSFLCVFPLYLKKEDTFVMHHARQAFVLFILELAACVISAVPFLGPIISWLAFVVFGIASLAGIYKVLVEEKWDMPYISEIASKIKF